MHEVMAHAIDKVIKDVILERVHGDRVTCEHKAKDVVVIVGGAHQSSRFPRIRGAREPSASGGAWTA